MVDEMFRRDPQVPKEVEALRRASAQHRRLTAMFEAHHAMVWRTLRRAGLDADTAADVGQQAFVIAFERVDDIYPGRERAFLLGTALRLSRSLYRRRARYQLEDMDLRSAVELAERAPLELIDGALAKLDPSLRDVLVLHDVEGLSSPEIAQALELALGTVASRLRRARREFRGACHRFGLVHAREGARR
jgi:RNA polymerase sigma-70 factor, ECF subfamily